MPSRMARDSRIGPFRGFPHSSAAELEHDVGFLVLSYRAHHPPHEDPREDPIRTFCRLDDSHEPWRASLFSVLDYLFSLSPTLISGRGFAVGGGVAWRPEIAAAVNGLLTSSITIATLFRASYSSNFVTCP